MGWYLGAAIGLGGRCLLWIATGVTLPLCGDGRDDVPCFMVAMGSRHDLIAWFSSDLGVTAGVTNLDIMFVILQHHLYLGMYILGIG